MNPSDNKVFRRNRI